MNTKHTHAKTATKILQEHSIDIMKMDDEFNSQLLHAMERYAEQYAKEQNAELLEALEELMKVYEQNGQLLSFDVNIARNAIKKATL
jgi:DNA-directed RNA polymerase subunit F